MNARGVWPIVIVALAGLTACSSKAEGGNAVPFRPITVGARAPAYAARVIDGDSVRVGARIGAPLTLLNIWATWCVPCRREFPELERLHRDYGTRGLRVVGVSVDVSGNDDRVRQTARALGGTFAIARDADGDVQDLFRAVGVPETFLISHDGTLLWRHVGDITPGAGELERVIVDHLPERR